MNKTVILLSGGIDSTTLAYYLKKQGNELYPIIFDYGQRHKKEIQVAIASAISITGANPEVIDISNCSNIFKGSALTDNIQVPTKIYDRETMSQTVVPNRNMIFISFATAYAMTIHAELVAYAAHSGDHFIYPDCRPEFAQDMNNAIQDSSEALIHLITPFIHKSKAQIIKIGIELRVPFENTWSCYNGQELACGKCGTCVERLEAFELNNIQDPIKYK